MKYRCKNVIDPQRQINKLLRNFMHLMKKKVNNIIKKKKFQVKITILLGFGKFLVN